MTDNKRPPGRPPLPPDQKAGSTVIMRTTKRDKARWVQTAQRNGQNLTTWITETLNKNSRFDDEKE